MAKKKQNTSSGKTGTFKIEGKIRREQSECESQELQLGAYAFDIVGKLLGKSEVDSNGKYSISVQLTQPNDVQLIVGPMDDSQKLRHSSAYSKNFFAKEWKSIGSSFNLHYDVVLPLNVWRPWWPKRNCVSGHIRKISTQDAVTEVCPVPYVKVEIFDVDREACWSPWLEKWREQLLDRRVLRIPELIKDPPFPPRPFPGPDPAPDFNIDMFSGQIEEGALHLERVGLYPKTELPLRESLTSANRPVGETSIVSNAISERMDKLTLTSKIAPWHIFSKCFYSKNLVCETTTDCDGYFKCCFNWWPFHFRRGRLRFDSLPDIIIKVTQIINGVTTVIYMDPYTSTRWNTTNTHIDLFLDNDEIVCGSDRCYEPPVGSPVFFTRIGNDEVYQINQGTGFYNNVAFSNVAYGSTLKISGQFGDNLTNSDPAHGDPPPYYYYRLSYAEQGSSDDEFKFINVDLNDTRVAKGTLIGEGHKLGPFTVDGVPSLYEVRNFNDYYWYNPDWIGTWHSWLAEEDTGSYILRLEVFDKNGNKINSASGTVDYRNGAGSGNGIPPAPLPAMVDHCDLLITLDNKAPIAELEVPDVINECGVIPWAMVPPLDLFVNASQENNRLRGWSLWYTKGVGSEVLLEDEFSNNGLPGSYVNHLVSGAPLLTGVNSTCAFALRLRAWAHIRNGKHFIYHDQDIDAITIEKCPPCPPSP